MQVSDFIENRSFDEIAVGESASLTRTLSKDDIALIAVMSGDVNPAHLDERYERPASVCSVGEGNLRPGERAACSPDAFRFCANDIPDPKKMENCLLKGKAN